MFETFESDEFAELFEDYESDESDESDEYFVEYDERSGGRRRRPAGRGPKLKTAKRGNAVPSRASPGYATKAELKATADRLDARIGVNSKAIQAADAKIRSLDTETGRIGAALKKETTDRKAETDALKKALAESKQIAMMLPLLSSQTTVQVKDIAGNTQNAVVDNGGTFSKILPMLLLSGGLSGSPGGGDSNSMMPLIMMMAIGR
jgi:hypothetical protein